MQTPVVAVVDVPAPPTGPPAGHEPRGGGLLVDRAAGDRAAAGDTDRRAIEDFFRTNYQGLLRSVRYAGASQDEAEDAVGAAVRDLLVRWAEVASPLAWCRRAALHSFVKARKRERERRIREASPKAAPHPHDQQDGRLSLWEDQQWVLQLLGELTPAQQEVVALLFDDFSQKEISELLGKTPATVRQNLAAARSNLRSKVPPPPEPSAQNVTCTDTTTTTSRGAHSAPRGQE